MSAVSASVCKAMEMATARCLMRWARFSDCGSQSTRQFWSEQKPFPGTRGASRDIRHLREISCERVGRICDASLRRLLPKAGAALAGM